MGKNCSITKSKIGRYCLIGYNVSIGVSEYNLSKISSSALFYKKAYVRLTALEVIIGNDVWIGVDSIIKRGIKKGNGAVIGANSFVNKYFPNFAVVVGSPAKIINYRFEKEKTEFIGKSMWWDKLIDEAAEIIKIMRSQT